MLEVVEQQAAVDDRGEPGGGAGAMFVPAAGEGAEEFDQRVGGRTRSHRCRPRPPG
ncbi:hypothetical protein [Streptomyces caniscabiei]|uniref:hypothetical protein n=1 Tax=Streptomyces caniscabiei TaxID=2746961 RepID=UPI0029B15D5E|nr:hypothetical protein [Streptomyces caniscabiei]MDX2953481.1 hypothetical protein [Streptomyces caniscabiei]